MITLTNVCKSYRSGNQRFQVSNNICLNISKGEFALLVGESGAGKSTILNIISGLEKPDSGAVTINGTNICTFNEKKLADFRKDNVGFVFQFYNLIPNLTVRENIELVSKMKRGSFKTEDVLEQTGLSGRINNFPSQLSGGEQQRVSIARAIVKKPKILLCDEPTGALDYKTSKGVLNLLQQLSIEHRMTVVMVTHNRSLLPMADQVFEISDGKIANKTTNKLPKSVNAIDW